MHGEIKQMERKNDTKVQAFSQIFSPPLPRASSHLKSSGPTPASLATALLDIDAMAVPGFPRPGDAPNDTAFDALD
jgi:hypothetical protein